MEPYDSFIFLAKTNYRKNIGFYIPCKILRIKKMVIYKWATSILLDQWLCISDFL